MLYVFNCRRGECLKKHNAYKVFRAQLPLENPYYVDYELESDEEEDEEDEKYLNRINDALPLCNLCGCHGIHRSKQAEDLVFCSEAHETFYMNVKDGKQQSLKKKGQKSSDDIDQKVGMEQKMRQLALAKASNRNTHQLVYEEWEIVTEDEQDLLKDRKDKTEGKIKDMISQYYDALKDENTRKDIENAQIDESQIKQADVDPEFLKFQDKIRLEPEQVLRYSPSASDTPLWLSLENKDPEVPSCPHCGADRVFELQILPQLLYYLKPDNMKTPEDEKDPNYLPIEWGTLVIYTCKNSCNSNVKNGDRTCTYLEEFLHQQIDE